MAHRTEGWCSPTLTHNTRRSRGGGGSLERAKLLSQCTACLAATMAYVISQVRTIVSRGGTNARAARSAPSGARPSRVPPPCRPAYRRPLREDISRCRRETTVLAAVSRPAYTSGQSSTPLGALSVLLSRFLRGRRMVFWSGVDICFSPTCLFRQLLLSHISHPDRLCPIPREPMPFAVVTSLQWRRRTVATCDPLLGNA